MATKKPGILMRAVKAEYVETARAQRESAFDIANKLEKGVAICATEVMLAAALLRHWGENLPLLRPKNVGGLPYVDVGRIVEHYALLRNMHGKTITASFKEIAENWDVTEVTIRKAIKKYGIDKAESLLPKNPNLKRK